MVRSGQPAVTAEAAVAQAIAPGLHQEGGGAVAENFRNGSFPGFCGGAPSGHGPGQSGAGAPAAGRPGQMG
jgi:hypothetical protein